MIEHYYGHDPLLQIPGDHSRCPVTPERWTERIKIIRQGFSLAAVDENDRSVGVAITKVMQSEELEMNWREVNEQKSTDSTLPRLLLSFETQVGIESLPNL